MTQQSRRSVRRPPRLSLLGGFSLDLNGSSIALPIHAQRVLAYLSVVHPAPPSHLRASLAGRLWDGVCAERSNASLRTALWRIRQVDPHLVQTSRERLRLDDAVEVDVRRGVAQAGRLLNEELDLQQQDADISALRGDLLPDWDEDWLLLERERIRQLQIHALEALAQRLRRLRRYADAIEAAFAAISHEPLRESAHVALIEIFLDEGNVAQAHYQLKSYASMLWSELGIMPSTALMNRVTTATGAWQTIPGNGFVRSVE